MSKDEQDLLIGKTVREESDLSKELASIDQKLAAISEGLRTLAYEINKGSLAQIVPVVVPDSLNKHIDLEQIVSIANSRIEIDRKLKTARAYLVRMGLRKYDSYDGAPRFD